MVSATFALSRPHSAIAFWDALVGRIILWKVNRSAVAAWSAGMPWLVMSDMAALTLAKWIPSSCAIGRIGDMAVERASSVILPWETADTRQSMYCAAV